MLQTNERVKKRHRDQRILSAATHEAEKATATGLIVLVHDAA
jgi:hypothetical protein